jgi:hypothetical protein
MTKTKYELFPEAYELWKDELRRLIIEVISDILWERKKSGVYEGVDIVGLTRQDPDGINRFYLNAWDMKYDLESPDTALKLLMLAEPLQFLMGPEWRISCYFDDEDELIIERKEIQ